MTTNDLESRLKIINKQSVNESFITLHNCMGYIEQLINGHFNRKIHDPKWSNMILNVSQDH